MWMLGALAGAALGSGLSWQGWGLLALMLLPVLCLRRWRALALAGLVGLIWTGGTVQWRLADRWPAELDGARVSLCGIVQGWPVELEPGLWRWDLRPVPAAEGSRPLLRGQVRVVHHWAPSPRDRVCGRWRLRAPRGQVNAGLPDLSRHALSRHVSARAGVVGRLEHEPAHSLWWAWREQVVAPLARQPGIAGRLLPSLVNGDQRGLLEQDWALMQRTGIVHLVSVSGLHLTLVCGGLWQLLRVLLRPLTWRSRWSSGQWAALPALLAGAGYGALAGFELPALRAWVMVAVWLLCRSLARVPARWAGLALSALVALLVEPLSLLQESFWLSWGGVALLMWLDRQGAGSLWRSQWPLSLALGALAAWMFADWGLLSPLANLVMVPLYSLVVTPWALLVALVPPLAGSAAWLGAVVEASWQLLKLADGFNPRWPVPTGPVAVLGVLMASLGALLRSWPWPRLGSLLLCLPWLWPPQDLPRPGQFDLVVLDVGQGQALAVRTAAGLVLYDLAPPGTGRRVLAPWLARQRQPVRLAIVSHGDADHAGGLEAVRRWLPADHLYSGTPERVPGSLPCVPGQRWELGGVGFRVLWPPPAWTGSANARSCVLLVQGAHGSALLTGDVPAAVERALLPALPVPHGRRLLVLSHHGARDGNSHALLRHWRPHQAVASVGWANRFGHPADAILERLHTLHIPLVTTATGGMIVFRVRGSDNPAPRQWRAEASRPWH